MVDCVATDLDLVLKRINALYRYDSRGRLVSINQWNGGVAPRFYLMRTAESVICRFGADLPDDLVSRLEELSARKPPADLWGGCRLGLGNIWTSLPPTRLWIVSGPGPPMGSRKI